MSAFATSMRSVMRAAPRAATPARSFTTSSPRSIARISITGRLVAPPEEVATSSAGIIKYTVASRDGGKKQLTSFFPVAVFAGNSASQREFLLNLPKGTLVNVDAHVQINKYMTNEGRERVAYNFNQQSIEVLLRGRSEGDTNGEEAHVEEGHVEEGNNSQNFQ